MNKINIGKIVNAVGLKGELKIYHYSDYKERFSEFSTVLIEDREFKIERVRYMKNLPILKLEGVDDRNGAEALKGKEIDIEEKDLRELPADTYYVKDLIGVKVFDAESGGHLGNLSDVIQNSAQDIYEVEKKDGGKFLVPAVGEFVLGIDMEKRAMQVRLIPGLME